MSERAAPDLIPLRSCCCVLRVGRFSIVGLVARVLGAGDLDCSNVGILQVRNARGLELESKDSYHSGRRVGLSGGNQVGCGGASLVTQKSSNN